MEKYYKKNMISKINFIIINKLSKNIYLISSIIFLFVLSCQYLEKPKNILSEEQMADILLDMAIFDETPRINPSIKPEEAYKHVFSNHNITIDDYIENYAYYISKKKIKYIISLSEKKLMNKDSKIQNYINKKTDGI